VVVLNAQKSEIFRKTQRSIKQKERYKIAPYTGENKMATTKERDKEHGKAHLAMNTPPIVSQQEWEAARQQASREGEGLDPLP
jgi:hypothetical protein